MELIDLLFNRDELYEGAKSGMENFYPAIAKMVEDKLREEEEGEEEEGEEGLSADRMMQSFEDFQQRFVKEAMWLWDGQFSRIYDLLKEEVNKNYSKQEQRTLTDFYQANPWVLPKQKMFGNCVVQKILPISVEVAEQAIKNLEERGEIEEIEAKMSGAGED